MFMQYTFENWICTELIVVLMLGNGQVLVTAITKVKLKVLFLILKSCPNINVYWCLNCVVYERV